MGFLAEEGQGLEHVAYQWPQGRARYGLIRLDALCNTAEARMFVILTGQMLSSLEQLDGSTRQRAAQVLSSWPKECHRRGDQQYADDYECNHMAFSGGISAVSCRFTRSDRVTVVQHTAVLPSPGRLWVCMQTL